MSQEDLAPSACFGVTSVVVVWLVVDLCLGFDPTPEGVQKHGIGSQKYTRNSERGPFSEDLRENVVLRARFQRKVSRTDRSVSRSKEVGTKHPPETEERQADRTEQRPTPIQALHTPVKRERNLKKLDELAEKLGRSLSATEKPT